MAHVLRSYWEQETKQGFTDRIEILEDGFAGTEIQLEGDETGFTFKQDEITSESNEGLLNIHANKIQIGKLDFRPRIDPNDADEIGLLNDIRDSSNRQFIMQRKKDGVVWWAGYITTKIFTYPEKATEFFAHIRATDLEGLKGVDYTLDDTRQTFIQTISDILGDLAFGLDIHTQTSWITEDTTDSTDFLSQVYHETKALRDIARTGDETDQPVSKWQALKWITAPALLIRQINGAFYIDQISEYSDPQNVNQTIYNPNGTVKTATATVDFRQTGYTSADSGTPSVKVSSQNESYPGIKRVKTKFNHRTQISGITTLSADLNSGNPTETFTQLFIGDGDETLTLSGVINAYFATADGNSSANAQYEISIGSYYLQDDLSWDTVSNTIDYPLTFIKPLGTDDLWRAELNVITDPIPDAADGTLSLVVKEAIGDVSTANRTTWDVTVQIDNAAANENSLFIDFQLTQTPDYADVFDYRETIFGDGPTGYSLSALRFGTGDGDLTADSWQRRGDSADGYRNFHENLLKEILDFQRLNTRKLNANLWGDYDPSKVLVYDGNNYYYAGGRYESVYARWNVNLLKVEENKATDTFDDIPKFEDEGSVGTSSISQGSGGLDQATADARYLNESANLSDLDSAATAITNLGITATAAELNTLEDISIGNNNAILYTDSIGDIVNSSSFIFDGTNFTAPDLNIGATGHGFDSSGNVSGDLIEGNELRINEISGAQYLVIETGNLAGINRIGVGDVHADLGEYAWAFFTTDSSDGIEKINIVMRGGSAQGRTEFWAGGSEIARFNDDGNFWVNGNTVIDNLTNFSGANASFSGTLDVTGLSSLDGGVDINSNILLNSDGTSSFSGIMNIGTGTSYSDSLLKIRNDDSTVLTSSSVVAGNHSAGILIDNLSTTADMGSPITWRGRATGTALASIAATFPSANNSILRFYVENGGTFAEAVRIDSAVNVHTDLAMTAGDIGTDNFVTGFQGTGHQTTYAGDGVFESVFIRGGLTVSEIILNRLRYQDGGLIVGSGGGKIASVTGSAGSEVVTFEDPEGNDASPFTAGQIVLVQDFDLNRTTVVKRLFRRVASINTTPSPDEFTLSDLILDNETTTAEALDSTETGVDVVDASKIIAGDVIQVESEQMHVDSKVGNTLTVQRGYNGTTAASHTSGLAVDVYAPDDTGSLAASDEMVAIGHVSDTTLDSLIYMSAVDQNNPFMRIMDGVSSVAEWKVGNDTALKGQFGNLEGVYGYADGTEIYGIAAGDPSADYVTVDSTNGIRFIDGADSDKVLGQFSGQVFTFGDVSKVDDFIEFDNTLTGVTAQAQLSTLEIDAGTFYLDSESGLVLGASASSQTLKGSLEEGFYTNISGHFRAGSMGAGGELSAGFLWDGTSAEIIVQALEIDATEVYISSSNKRVAVGADGSAVTVANTTAGTVMQDTGFKSYLNSSNYIRRDGSSLDIKSSVFDLNTTGLVIDSSVPSITSTGDVSESVLTDGILEFTKVSGTGSIRTDINDTNGLRFDMNGANYKVARFQEDSVPIIGVPNTYTSASGGAATALPSNPVAYVPVEIADDNTGTVSLYVYPVYDPASVPSAPTGVSLCAASAPDGIQISWNAVTGADSYKIERAESSSGPWFQIYDNTATSYVDTFAAGLNSANTYFYRVFTVDNGLTSTPSSTVSGEYDNLTAC